MFKAKTRKAVGACLAMAAVCTAVTMVPAVSKADSSSSSAISRQMESLNRGLVAVNTGSGNFLSWRLLGTEDYTTKFNVYRNGALIATNISDSTNFVDAGGNKNSSYKVCSVVNGKEVTQSDVVTPWGNNYKDVPLNKPANTTLNGTTVTYSANDATVADVDGDGAYEIIVKWDPSNSKDNSQSGYTSNVYVDCYEMDGTQRWRIDLGKNIRAGAHYTQIIAYDLNGDGKAEVAMKTADGTIAGDKKVIGDASKDYRNSSGYVLSGPEYLTLFEGSTGKELVTIDYNPARGTVSSWGDKYGNRVDRFLAGVAYLDGKTPSLIMCRGYYTRTVIAAYEYKGGKLNQEWVFDTNASGNSAYAGQGNHNLSIADVDGDYKDEIVYGSAVIDNNGKGLYTTGDGHGDALHVGDFDPKHNGLEIFQVHENKTSDIESIQFRDAKSGKTIWAKKLSKDIGRGLIVNIGPDFYPFVTLASSGNYHDSDGNAVTSSISGLGINFATYWDGDLYRETLDGTTIRKWDYNNKRVVTVLGGSSVHSNNGTKSTPSLSADIIGDWREEVIWPTSDDKALRIYTTTDVTDSKLYTLMHDSQYRCAIAWQNVGYNQPPHTSYYIGEDMSTPKKPAMYTVGNYKLAAAEGNNQQQTTQQQTTAQQTTQAPTQAPTQQVTTQQQTQAPTQAPVSSGKYMFNPTKGTSNSYFTVAGSIVSDKGSATVNGSTISKALKLDSKGSVTFKTTTDGAKLTIYTKGKKSGSKIKVNGDNKFTGIGTTVVAKTITLGNAGTYKITKGTNETYLFYVIVEEAGSSSEEVTTQQATTQQATTQQATTQQATTQQATTQQATTQQATTQQATTQQQTQAPTQQPEAGSVKFAHNFTTDGTNSDYLTFSSKKNLATGKGTYTYNGVKLTKCLKVESSTTVTFTTTKANAKLVMVVNSKASSGALKISGPATAKISKLSSTVEVREVTLGAAGTYTISKDSSENYIYYISVTE